MNNKIPKKLKTLAEKYGLIVYPKASGYVLLYLPEKDYNGTGAKGPITYKACTYGNKVCELTRYPKNYGDKQNPYNIYTYVGDYLGCMGYGLNECIKTIDERLKNIDKRAFEHTGFMVINLERR